MRHELKSVAIHVHAQVMKRLQQSHGTVTTAIRAQHDVTKSVQHERHQAFVSKRALVLEVILGQPQQLLTVVVVKADQFNSKKVMLQVRYQKLK